MAYGEDWSALEVEVCVKDYLDMLTMELNGQSYNKTRHREALLPKLDGRTDGSVEQKHRNISSVMQRLGYPIIRGYRPLPNAQRSLLIEVIEDQLKYRPQLDAAAICAVEKPAIQPSLLMLEGAKVRAPKLKVKEDRGWEPRFSAAKRDYLEMEARNRSLGLAGEEFIVSYEFEYLRSMGRLDLANRVEHVAKSQGDGLGFDVLSFEPYSGRERLIEVKTTSFDLSTPFFVTRNEVARSERDAEKYELCRVFNFRSTPRFFSLEGSIPSRCSIEPVSWSARPKGD